ncbi:TPA: terminase large subunit, partial [Clostridioides difficile]|nr:terminase large subunit [Clostridioides difficile]
PKTIKYFRQQGFNISGAKKYAGSRLQNTKKVKRFKKIYCSSECKHTIKELKNLTYATDKNGNLIYDEFNIDPHTFSAIWYGLDGYEVSDIKELKYSNDIYNKGLGLKKNNQYNKKGGTVF